MLKVVSDLSARLWMSGGNKKITHTWTNLQLKAAGLFKYVWPFCYQQRLKVYGNIIDVFRTLPNIFFSKKFHHRRLTFPKRYCTIRKSHRKCSLKKGFLKNFAIFTGKHLCWSFFLIKFQGCSPATLLKRDSNTYVFLWMLWNF